MKVVAFYRCLLCTGRFESEIDTKVYFSPFMAQVTSHVCDPDKPVARGVGELVGWEGEWL